MILELLPSGLPDVRTQAARKGVVASDVYERLRITSAD